MNAHPDWWELRPEDFGLICMDIAQSITTIHREFIANSRTNNEPVSLPFVVIRREETKLVLVRQHASGFGGFCASRSIVAFAEKVRRVHPIPASTIPTFNRFSINRDFYYEPDQPKTFPAAMRLLKPRILRNAQRIE